MADLERRHLCADRCDGVEPDNVLYGTDWPISTMKSYLNFMKQLDLPEEKKELILWKNAAKLFKIDVSQL